jgi:hypothetical protein
MSTLPLVHTPAVLLTRLRLTLFSALISMGVIMSNQQAEAATSTASAPASSHAPAPVAVTKAPGAFPSDAEGFAFLNGQWQVQNRKLKDVESANKEWQEFVTKARFFTLLDGLVSVEELRNAKGEPFGSAMRTFDREKRTWSDAWVSARDGVLQLPSHGRFEGNVGTWITEDEWNGKKILARGLWKRVSKNEVIWEQAISNDKGKTWDTNWFMRFERVDENGKLVK